MVTEENEHTVSVDVNELAVPNDAIVADHLSLGIDPGTKGAFALVDIHNPYENYAIYPFEEDNQLGMAQVLATLRSKVVSLTIERQTAFGKPMVIANLFKSLGMWHTLLHLTGYDYDTSNLVLPRVWQSAIFGDMLDQLDSPMPPKTDLIARQRRLASRRGQLKTISVKEAQKRFKDCPLTSVSKGHDKADALWLAMYGRKHVIALSKLL